MQSWDELLVQVGPSSVVIVTLLLIVVLVAALILLNQRRMVAIRERDQHEKALQERERKMEQLERRLEVLGDFTYVSDFRLDRIYTLLTNSRLEVDGDSYSHGVVRDEQGRLAPFFTQQSLSHLEAGDTFSRVRNELVKLERDEGVGAGDTTEFGIAAADPAATVLGAGVAGSSRQTPSPAAATMLFRPPVDAALLNKDPNSGQPYVKVIRGKDEGMLTYVPFGEITIGRDAGNAVRLHDSSSSRVHCRIVYEGNQFVLRDNNSTNGTVCNRERITEHVLNFDDRIQVGDTELVFSCQGYDLKDQDPRQAIAAFEDCLEREPNYIGALRVLAYLLERDVARKKEAQPLWDKATRLEKASGKAATRR